MTWGFLSGLRERANLEYGRRPHIYETTLVASEGKKIDLDHLKDYMAESLETIDEEAVSYDFDYNFWIGEEILDPMEVKYSVPFNIPHDRANVKLQASSQEAIDEFVSEFEDTEKYDFDSDIAYDSKLCSVLK